MTDIKEPHSFQERVFGLLSKGHNVILQAPTGSGKTHAALYPFLYYLAEGQSPLPRKCVYAVPMRVLANQFVEKYRPDVERHDSRFKLRLPRPDFPGSSCAEIMTGEQPHDKRFEAALTFATIDQVPSSYLLIPYSLPRRLANFNAGAVAASYLVFDEFHLFDPISTLPTTLEMLRQLNGIAPFLLMTATFSRDMLKALADKLEAEVVPDSEEERAALQRVESQQKTRRYHAIDGVLSAGAILEHHGGGRTLVVCNTVDRARTLYESLDHDNKILLHSRFLSNDRQAYEDMIRSVFAKDAPKDIDTIVVSTQAIEVGLDITCRTLITELAPANAIVQRAGRCARYAGEKGDVFVYSRAYDPRSDTVEVLDLRERVLPYRGLEEETVSTWEMLTSNTGAVYDFQMEQQLVSEVHGPRDREIIDGIGARQSNHRRLMFTVMRGDSLGAADLIRKIRSYRVTIHSSPEMLKDEPLAADFFSLSDAVLYGAFDDLQARGDCLDEGSAPVTVIHEISDEHGRRATDEENRTIYGVRIANEKSDLPGATLIVLHPDVATYDPQLGLLLNRGGAWECEPVERSGQAAESFERISYRLESYQDHVRLVWQAFDQVVWPVVAGAAARMEQAFGWPLGSLRRAAELAVLLHDVGKLDTRWQRWAHAWQEAQRNPIPDIFAAAHTDYNSSDPEERQRASNFKPRRPPHAGEGAYASLPLLAAGLSKKHSDLVRAAFTAILRHHTPFAEDHQNYHLIDAAPDIVADTLGDLPVEPSQLSMQPGLPADQFVVQPEHEAAFLGYVLLARVLRHSDQLSTAWGSKM